jgi:aminoglycoside phosphotransferase
VTYRYYADSEEHALFLVGVLNSHVVNEAIKPYQTQGLQGERDIHRRPFEVCPIPLFDPKNRLHQQIARVAAQARKKVLPWKDKIEGNAGQAREKARNIVQSELSELNDLVVKLLDGHRFLPDPSARNPRRSGNLFLPDQAD